MKTSNEKNVFHEYKLWEKSFYIYELFSNVIMDLCKSEISPKKKQQNTVHTIIFLCLPSGSCAIRWKITFNIKEKTKLYQWNSTATAYNTEKEREIERGRIKMQLIKVYKNNATWSALVPVNYSTKQKYLFFLFLSHYYFFD